MHGSMRRVRQKFAETEMNQHFGKTLATHFHVINTTQDSHTSNHNKASPIHQTTRITYTSNHNKASPIHQTTSITYTSNHKLHIYIKPQVSHTHIHQTTSFIYTYTSNHKLFLHKRRKNRRNG